MLIEHEIFDQLCPSYQNAVKEFEKEYEAGINGKNEYLKITKLFDKFSQNYLTLPQFWDKYFRLLKTVDRSILPDGYNHRSKRDQMKRKSRNYHFFSTKHGFKKLYDKKKRFRDYSISIIRKIKHKDIEDKINFPQKGMDLTLKFYEMNTCSPIPKRIYENFDRMKKLYTEIVEAENNLEKWFYLIIKVDNKDFVKNNIEFRLGKNLLNKKLWKLYFNYLKQNNDTKSLLLLYSRYCRFFIDDLEIKNEYEKTCEIYVPSFVSWKNAFDFEIYQKDPSFCSPDRVYPEITAPNLKFLFDGYKSQEFALPKTIMFYLSKNGNPSILHKLHKCCKYFFLIMPYPVCYNLKRYVGFGTHPPYSFHEQSVVIRHKLEANFAHKLIMSGTFVVSPSSWRNCLTEFLPNILQCNIKHLTLYQQDLTFKEYKFIVEHGNIEAMELDGVKIVNQKNENVALEEILELVPKVVQIRIYYYPCITCHTYKNLLKLNFINKFHILEFFGIIYLEPYGFCEFIKKNFNSDSIFDGSLGRDTDYEIRKAAIKIVETELRPQWPVNEKNNVLFSLN